MNSGDVACPSPVMEGEGGCSKNSGQTMSTTCETVICNDNKANIKIRVSSNDEVEELVKLQRSNAQDEDASVDSEIDSLTKDMQTLSATGTSNTNDERRKTLLSGQNSSNETNSPCLSRDSSTELYTDSTGIDLQQFITSALQSKDRMFLLNIEKDVLSFVNDESKQSHQFTKMNTYHRMLVHRVAAFFGLEHNVDKSTESVIITRTKNTRIPDLKFDDVQVIRIESENQEPKKVLKRNEDGAGSFDKSPDRRGVKGSSRSQSYEERIEKYVEARERIFKSQASSSSDGGDGSHPMTISETADCSVDAAITANSSLKSSQDDVAEKPWSSVDSDSSGRLQRVPKVDSDAKFLSPNYGQPVRKSHSFAGSVNQGPASAKLTKASSLNTAPTANLRPLVQEGSSRNIGEQQGSWSKSPANASHQNKVSMPQRNWQPRDNPQSTRFPNHGYRRQQQQQNWAGQTRMPNVVYMNSHLNPGARYKDQNSHPPEQQMLLQQMANMLHQSESQPMPNQGVFYTPVPPTGPLHVQTQTHPKGAMQQRMTCNGQQTAYTSNANAQQGCWSDEGSRNGNPSLHFNQGGYGGAMNQMAGPSPDPRFMYLNTQYSVQSPYNQSYVLMPTGIRHQPPNFPPNFSGQSMVQQPVMPHGSQSVTFIPSAPPMMHPPNGAGSAGPGLLPLPYTFSMNPNQVPQNFQAMAAHPQMSSVAQNPMFKNSTPPQNMTPPQVVANPSPGMPVQSSMPGHFVPGFAVNNSQPSHNAAVFYHQMCPPPRMRHTGRGHIR